MLHKKKKKRKKNKKEAIKSNCSWCYSWRLKYCLDPSLFPPHLWVKISRRRRKQKGKKTPAFIYAKTAHNTYPQTWSKHAAHKHIIHAWYSSEYERKQTHQKRPWRRLPNLAPQLLACFYFKEELHLWLHFTHGSLGSIIPWFTAVRVIKCALFNRSGQLKWGSLWSASLFFLCHIYIFCPHPLGLTSPPQQCIFNMKTTSQNTASHATWRKKSKIKRVECVKWNKHERGVQNTAAPGNEDRISLVTSAVQIFLVSA